MYIKKVRKKNPGSDKVYEYLHLVENVRTVNGPRQRLILNLGQLDIPRDQYKELANCIECQITGQNEFIVPDPMILEIAEKAAWEIAGKKSQKAESAPCLMPPETDYQNVDVASIEAGESRTIGPEHVCHSIWNELGLSEVLIQNGVSPHQIPLLEALVVGRLVSPGSERHTFEWLENRSSFFELAGSPLRNSLNSFYRAGDSLFACKEALEKHLVTREKELFSLTEKMCFFDLTNTYFEGQASANPKAKHGRSKEKRSDCRLMTLAMVVDEQGFAKYSKLYPGNQAEGKTLESMIESIGCRLEGSDKDRTVVIDAGIADSGNIDYLKAKGLHYIVVNRGKAGFSADDACDMISIKRNENQTIEVKRFERENETYLLCRSTGRKDKDQAIRSRQEDLFIERLDYYKSGIGKKGRINSCDRLNEKIGRLREKYPRASKLYDVEVIGDEAKKGKAASIKWEKRDRYDAELGLEGCYVLRTDRNNLSEKEIWETYMMLNRIERAFRSMKSSLGLRPNFHQNEGRADAHMFISVLGYHILHAIEHRLRMADDHRSWATIRDCLSTHQRITIHFNVMGENGLGQRKIRLCTTSEPAHKKIYQALGLPEVPLPRLKMQQKE